MGLNKDEGLSQKLESDKKDDSFAADEHNMNTQTIRSTVLYIDEEDYLEGATSSISPNSR